MFNYIYKPYIKIICKTIKNEDKDKHHIQEMTKIVKIWNLQIFFGLNLNAYYFCNLIKYFYLKNYIYLYMKKINK